MTDPIIYLNSQLMSDSFYHITESSEFNKKNKGPKHTDFAMLWLFFAQDDVMMLLTYSAMYDVMKSYLNRV